MCPKVGAPQQRGKFQWKQTFDLGIVPHPEQENGHPDRIAHRMPLHAADMIPIGS
jgi:hypothetical protein